ncbi:aspartic proteinase CDR1-like [Cucurbita moschata]|uniref:Aspartic proteinase CDR1-like n=1 Tax=Cucurbita moschata TaxID=3662 RepID=A0A6J1F107_CUCMO|nr:aspartic proteinase CDR1-like [Cucurbita moschata]
MAPTIFLLLALLSIAESTADKGSGLKLELIRRRVSPGNVSPMVAKSQIWPETSEFIVKIAVGTPSTEVHAILDTGSDLFWAQCRPCVKCYQQTNPIYDPSKSSTFRTLSCKSPQCHLRGSGAACSGTDTCKYDYGYESGSTQGELATEKMAVTSRSGATTSFPEVVFGCGHNNSGTFNANEMGLIGFGRGAISFVSQIGPSVGGRKFSLCLMPYNTDPRISSSLSIGSGSEVQGPGVITAQLVRVSHQTYYSLTLTGISVGKTLVPYSMSGPLAKGNTILDTGTPQTLLPKELYGRLAAEVRRHIPSKPIDDTLCYKDNLGDLVMTLHFDGDVDLRLSTVQTFNKMPDGSFCFTAMGVDDNDALIGNSMMANFLVGYDIDNMTVSFKSTDCTKIG